MKHTMRWGGLLSVLLIMGFANAQNQAPYAGGGIESDGVATVESPPDYVEFWLHKTAQGATAAETVAAAALFETQLDDQIKTAEWPAPSSKEVSEMSFGDINRPAAKVSAHLTFSARPFANPKTGLADFAKLCDGMTALAKTLACTIEGPFFSVAAKSETEQAAVARAVEQALAPALGAAQVLKTRIESVDSVVVKEVVWNREPDTRAAQPQIRRVTCTARVHVKYLFSTGV